VAIARACKRAGVDVRAPYRIRHTRATELWRLYDIESAQVLLGHSHPDTTLIYAERDLDKAKEVMRQVG
jgi:integrase